jgi:hypothetical protein
VIVHTTDGGARWTPQASGVQTSLYALAAPTRNALRVAGDGGVLLRSTDAGNTWLREYCPSAYNLFSLDFVNADEGWLSGDFGTILHLDSTVVLSVEAAPRKADLRMEAWPNPVAASTSLRIRMQHPPSREALRDAPVSLQLVDALGRICTDLTDALKSGLANSASDAALDITLTVPSTAIPAAGMYHALLRVGTWRLGVPLVRDR